MLSVAFLRRHGDAVVAEPDPNGRRKLPYFESVDIIRRNCTQVPAQHSTDPDSMRAEVLR